jgi:integrase
MARYSRYEKYRLVPIVEPGTWAYLNAYTNELRLPLEQRFHGALLRQLDHEELPLTKNCVEHLLLVLKSHFRTVSTVAPREQQHRLVSLCKKLHSHIFRASGATLMAAAGMDLVRLSLLMGHANPETTLRHYLAAEQMNLPLEVQQICLRIQEALDSQPSTPNTMHSPLGWYERKGYFTGREGGYNGSLSFQG